MAELKILKQEMFCREYIVDFNATKAAERAGYAKKAAGQQASRLLKDVKIRSRLAELIDARNERTQIDADWVLQRAAAMASFDIRMILDSQGNVMEPRDWPDIAGVAIHSIDVSELGGDDGTPLALIKKIKRVDPLRALEVVGRHVDVQAFKDRIEHSMSEDMASAIQQARKRSRREMDDDA